MVAAWERTLYAFLSEKERQSGSDRTVQSYSRMLHDFFGRTGKTPDTVSSQGASARASGAGLKLAGLPAGGVHVFRHPAAKLRRDAGETIEDVSRFLDRSSLAATTTYLRRLEGQEDKIWAKVAEAIGL